jgi:transcriptional regulator with XRE-family HTH domain
MKNVVSIMQKSIRKSSLPKTFKALQRETSVYKYFVELKENVFTEQGFFDLVKVPGLRIVGAGQFFKNLRIKNGLTQRDMAKTLNVSQRIVCSWENNSRTLSLQLLAEFGESNAISRDAIYSLIDEGEFKTKIGLPVKFDKICNIIQYFSPHEFDINGSISLINCSNETLSKIKSTLNVKPVLASGIIINSKELHNYLTTFFRYTKVPKIYPPLTREVKLWYDNNVDLKRAIIIPCLQSDGSASQGHSLRFFGNNKNLHDYFIDAMYYEYDLLPSSYFTRGSSNNCNNTAYVQKPAKKIIDEIMNLGGNTKTKPALEQTIEEYLKEPQPHLNYLVNASKDEQKIALRIWASAEGFISIYINHRTQGRVFPTLGIGCAHPDLAVQLHQIAQRFDIRFTINRSKHKWSGIDGLITSALNSCIEFLKIGGFIKGVKISANSPYHTGIDKDVLILGILEFKLRQKENQKLRIFTRKKIHDEINKIVKNGEYKPADHYINYFAQNDTML